MMASAQRPPGVEPFTVENVEVGNDMRGVTSSRGCDWDDRSTLQEGPRVPRVPRDEMG
jgi:hypothetical protein